MQTIYICEPYCTVHKWLEAIVIRKCGRKLRTIPLVNVGCIVIFRTTQVTTQALEMLFQKGIDVVFMTESGLVRGRLMAEKASNIVLRLAQYRLWNDMQKKVKLARLLLIEKAQNQSDLLLKYYRSRNLREFKEVADWIKLKSNDIKKAETIPAIMGIEGSCAQAYFSCFSKLLKGYNFTGRQRRPAYEPVNALLNLGYAFLANELVSRLYTYSFDIELGFMHGIRYGRKSLALDLMEPYRPIIDLLTLKLLNKKIFKEDDFDINQEECKLKPDVLRRFCEEYTKMMYLEPYEDENWNNILDKHVGKYRKMILKVGQAGEDEYE